MIARREVLLRKAGVFFKTHEDIPFNYRGDPIKAVHLSLQKLKETGWNCQGVPHRLYSHLGYPIPDYLLAAEMFFDEHTFRTLRPGEPIQELDIIHVAKPDIVPPCKNHQIVASKVEDSESLEGITVFHASKETGTTAQEPLFKLFDSGRYTQILAVKRDIRIEQVLFQKGSKPREVVFR